MEKERNMKTSLSMVRILGATLIAALGAVFLCSCEEHGDPEVVLTPSPAAPSATGSSSNPTTGKWTGTSGPDRASSTLSLTEATNGVVSGTLKWPNRTMSVTGTHTGALVRVQISCGDSWRMSYNGSKLSGTGTQQDGSSYGLMFKRE